MREGGLGNEGVGSREIKSGVRGWLEKASFTRFVCTSDATVPLARHSSPVTQILAIGAQMRFDPRRFPIPDSRFPIPDSRFPIPDSHIPSFPVPSPRLRLRH